MFGLIVAGRPVDAAPQEIAQGQQYAFKVAGSPSFHHIVVFLLPGTVLPPGAAASVYIQTSPAQGPRFYGGIGPGKESAIFKLNGIDSTSQDDVDNMSDGPTGVEVMVGIAIEDGLQVDAKIAELKASSGTSTALVRAGPTKANPITTKQLAKNIIGSAFDYLASFGSDVIPLKAFQDWWIKFEKKVDLDPSFLERARDG